MFYSMYLSSLCERRNWPEPLYEPYRSRSVHYCKVRVNNREYGTDVGYRSEELARESAATKAFMICRNFSANDGMFPGQRPGGSVAAKGMVQGLPVAIGSGRRNNRNSNSSVESGYSDSSSGSNSPESIDGRFGRVKTHPVPAMPVYQQQQQRYQGSRRRMDSGAAYSYACKHGEYSCPTCSRGW